MPRAAKGVNKGDDRARPSGFRRRGKFLRFRGGLQDGVLARALTPRPSDIGAGKIGSTQ